MKLFSKKGLLKAFGILIIFIGIMELFLPADGGREVISNFGILAFGSFFYWLGYLQKKN
jgi:hypothetical protein